jgi:hypothetical protein
MRGAIRYWRGGLLGGGVGLMTGLVVVVIHLHGLAFVPGALFGMTP